MLHIALCRVRDESPDSIERKRIERRVGWKTPDGLKVQAEYWLQTPDPKVIMVVETDDPIAMTQAVAAWDDLFDITIVPAVTAEEGIKLAASFAN